MQSSLNGRLRFTDRLGVSLSGSGLLNMREQPGLAAWFDSLDVASMLSSTGAIVAAGEAVALWSDRSGNSNERCLILPGTGYASTPHAAALDGAELDLRLDFTLDDYTPAAEQIIVSKYAVGQARFIVSQATDGTFVFYYSVDGTNLVAVGKDYNGGAPANFSRQRLRITYKNGETIKFYYGTGFDTWTLYETSTDPGAALSNSTAALQIGTYLAGTSNLIGKIYRVQIRDNVLDDGTGIVFDSDFSLPAKLATSFTESSVGAATVTIATGARIAGARDLYQGTAANRPIYLPWTGTNYGFTSQVGSTNYFSTPDSAALLNFRSSFTATFCLRTLDWTPASPQYIYSYGLIGSTVCNGLYIMPDGTIEFYGTQNGSVDVALATATSPGFTDGAVGYIRLTRNSSGGQTKIYKSTDGIAWTDITSAETRYNGVLYNTTAAFILGGYSGTASNSFTGDILSFSVVVGYDQTSGTAVAGFDPSLYTSGATFTAATGEVWTVNGGAHIVTRSGLYFDGSNDYLKSAAFSLSQPETIHLIGTPVSWTAVDYIFDGDAVNSGRLIQQTSTPTTAIYAGAAGVVSNGFTLATPFAVTAIFNNASSVLRFNRAAATTGTTGTSNMGGFTLGAGGNGSGAGNVFVSELAILSVAFTTAQQDRIALYAGAKWRFST